MGNSSATNVVILDILITRYNSCVQELYVHDKF
ncbi:MAG: hypothetical protein BROFUL_02880 [Candidatus Brocadia fulgida]|jgi:hypothetical protein|uniref:Uncharacterized protein n=1 Tax=Candidatus Brocadia fulgida TaxID=380242 RepID=A0A0M2UV95_9BACT|nr:MAG: hypothetical protein BROFUL_02880 [Candidatus Brocadia fulgida]